MTRANPTSSTDPGTKEDGSHQHLVPTLSSSTQAAGDHRAWIATPYAITAVPAGTRSGSVQATADTLHPLAHPASAAAGGTLRGRG